MGPHVGLYKDGDVRFGCTGCVCLKLWRLVNFAWSGDVVTSATSGGCKGGITMEVAAICGAPRGLGCRARGFRAVLGLQIRRPCGSGQCKARRTSALVPETLNGASKHSCCLVWL